jgi:hypothetical protein
MREEHVQKDPYRKKTMPDREKSSSSFHFRKDPDPVLAAC